MGLLIVNIFSIIAQSIASAYIMLLLHNKITNLKPDRKHFFKISLDGIFIVNKEQNSRYHSYKFTADMYKITRLYA